MPHANAIPRLPFAVVLAVASLCASVDVFAAERNVKLSVSVVDAENKPVEGATVTVTPPDGKAVTLQTNGEGEAVADLSIGDAPLGEGWISSAPALAVEAKKGEQIGNATVSLPAAAFKKGSTARTCRVVLKAPSETVEFLVTVKDENGKPLPTARVNIYSGVHSSKNVFLHRRGVVVPADYQADTGSAGDARFRIRVNGDGKADIALEVSREDKGTEKRDVAINAKPGSQASETFQLRPKAGDLQGPIITVAIDVRDSDSNPIENASVVILDASLGMATGRFTGVTKADGRALVRVLYGSASPEETLDLDVSKNGYKAESLSVHLKEADVGKTVQGRTVTLDKVSADAVKVTVTVIDSKTRNGIPDAKVVLDGPTYVSETTDQSGQAALMVSEPGGFALRVSQDNYRDFTDGVRLVKGETSKTLSVTLEEKVTKDEGEDTIEVTVLARDPTDEKSKPTPLAGALVKAGRVSTATDAAGVATLTGAFGETQEVTVQANGYVAETRTIRVPKPLHYARGSGKATFTLNPDLSEESPIRLVVVVHDEEDKPLAGADVDFLLPGNDVPLFGRQTNKEGESDFRSSDTPGTPVAALRQGLRLKVRKAGYKTVTPGVPPDLLTPTGEARRFSVALERDWTAIEAEIADLEGRVQAWVDDVKMPVPPKLAERNRALIEQANKLEDEINGAAKDFDIGEGMDAVAERFRKAKELQEAIGKCLSEVEERSQQITRLIEEATAAADRCASAEDPKIVRAKYQEAIRLLGEIGVRNKRAVKAREDLLPLAAQSLAMQNKIKELEAKLKGFEALIKEAEENAAAAKESFEKQKEKRAGLAARRDALKSEAAKLEKRAGEEDAPIPYKKRIQALAAKLGSTPLSTTPKGPDEKLIGAAEEIRTLQIRAERALAVFRKVATEIDTLAPTVEKIDKVFWDASAEVTLAADLPARADECEKKHVTAAAEEVTVPNLAAFAGLDEMKAAAKHAGLVPAIAAINTPPPAGSSRLFAGQEPPPDTKAKRGSTLKILIFQKLAQGPPEDVTVPDLSAFASIAEMKAALAHAGLAGAFNAKSKPPSKDLEFKFAGQSPAAGAKAKRDAVVSVLIYQKFEDTTPAADEVTVPAIFTGNTVATVKSALASVGLVPAFNAKGGRAPSQDLEYKTTGALDPPAGTKVAKGSTVTVSIYEKFEAAQAQASPTAPPLGPAPSRMPSLAGLTLEQAVARLPAGMRIGSDEIGDKPPSPDKALTIFWQDPPAGAAPSQGKETVVRVKRYGSAGVSAGPAGLTDNDPFVGVWRGKSFYGKDKVTITKQAGRYVITPEGHEFGYPVEGDGKKIWHQHGINDITWVLEGNTLRGTAQYKDIRGGSHQEEASMQRQ